MDAASKTFLAKFDRWLQENTKELPESDTDRCPICGHNNDPDLDIKAWFGGSDNVAASMNSGPWDACDWYELWRCDNRDCGAFFVVENSNY